MVAFRIASVAALLALFQATSAAPTPGPSGSLVSPGGATTVARSYGRINVQYDTVYSDWTETRSINLFLINANKGYNHTLATDLSAVEGANQILASFRVPQDYPGAGTDYQLQVIETQTFPGTTEDASNVPPFVSASPSITIVDGTPSS